MSIKEKFSNLEKLSNFSADDFSVVQSICVDVNTELDRLQNILAITPADKLAYTNAKIAAIQTDLNSFYERIVNHLVVEEDINDVYSLLDSIQTEVSTLLLYIN